MPLKTTWKFLYFAFYKRDSQKYESSVVLELRL